MVLTAALALLFPASQVPLAEIEFELVNGHIYVPATVNGNAASAIIDSGAGMSVMDSALADRWKLPSSGNLQARGIGKETVQGKFLKETVVRFGDIAMPMTIAIPLGGLTEAEGRPLETVIGYEFFRKHVVQIDYPARRLRVYAGDTNLSLSGTTLPIKIVGNHPHIATEMTVAGKAYPLQTMIDTGASGGGLSAKFLKANPLDVPATPRAVIGGGVGGFIEGRFFRPDALKIGQHSASKPVLTMTDAEGGASGENSSYDLLLGSDILRRFKVTFNYGKSTVTFEPSDELGKPFEADKTGLRLFAREGGLAGFRVMGVMPGSAAETAGLRKEDVIETINGKPAGSYKLHQLREALRSPDAKLWDLGVLRGSERLKVRIEPKSII